MVALLLLILFILYEITETLQTISDRLNRIETQVFELNEKLPQKNGSWFLEGTFQISVQVPTGSNSRTATSGICCSHIYNAHRICTVWVA
jgi:hypothetical protein